MVLSIYYQNVRGLRTKTSTVRVNSYSSDYAVICLTETNLCSAISDSEVLSCDFSVVRRDRSAQTSGKMDGGGVLIAIKDNFEYVVNSDWCSDAEDVWVTLSTTDGNKISKLHICCVYIPPGNVTALNYFLDKLYYLHSFVKDGNFLICGDFNLPHIRWANSGDSVPSNSYNNPSNDLIDCLSYCNLFQYNKVENHNNRILDLILSNREFVSVTRCDSPLTKIDLHHPPLVAYIDNVTLKYLNHLPRDMFLFKHAEYDMLNEIFLNINWYNEFSNLNLDNTVNKFYDILYGVIDEHVPRKTSRKDAYPIWYTNELIKLIKEKHKAHRKYKLFKSNLYYNDFSILRKSVKKLLKECYDKYIQNIESQIPSNTKKFWSYVSSLKKTNFPNCMSYGNKSTSEISEICNYFSEHFKSVYTVSSTTDEQNDLIDEVTQNNLSEFSVTENEVFDLMVELDVNKGAGPDDVPSIFIKKCATSLSLPLSIIFNKSVAEGSFPTLWKKAQITPIFKSGKKNMVENYRPISKLCIFEKLFERLIFKNLFLLVKSSIIPEQHGFFPGRSVETNLSLYADFLLKSMDERFQVDSVYTDFCKAFDTIDHKILLRKLKKAGVHGNLLLWFQSYLTDRKQCVVVNGYKSQYSFITSGVPQGSHLGPLLFIIFINDIKKCFLNSKFLLYADDMKIYHTITCKSDCVRLQQDLNRLKNYVIENNLKLNVSKCFKISFTRNRNIFNNTYDVGGENITNVSSVMDLGVTFDSKLIFDQHLNKIIGKSYKMLGFIFRTSRDFKCPKTFLSLYFTLVRSQLEFCTICWSPQYFVYISRIENIQNRFLKHFRYRFISFNLNLISLKNRRIMLDLSFLYKIINNLIDCPQLLTQISFKIPSFNSRTCELFGLPFNRTNSAINSPINRICLNYNTLSHNVNFPDIFATNIRYFKKCILNNLEHVNDC